MQLQVALDLYLLHLEADGRSLHTRNQYRRHVRLLGRWIGADMPVERVTPEDLARFLVSPEGRTRRGGGIKRATTMNALRASLRTFFGWLHRAGFVPRDPAHLVRSAMCSPAPPDHLEPDEQSRLLAAIDHPRDHALFHLMLGTGLRVGSVVALDMEDVDLDRREVTLRGSKGDRGERLPLARGVCDVLRRQLGTRTTGPLFPGRGGRRLTTRHIHRRLKMWLGKAGIRRRASPHTLRRSFATALYRRTRDILLVKEALGHRCIESTLVYARSDPNQLREALEG